MSISLAWGLNIVKKLDTYISTKRFLDKCWDGVIFVQICKAEYNNICR